MLSFCTFDGLNLIKKYQSLFTKIIIDESRLATSRRVNLLKNYWKKPDRRDVGIYRTNTVSAEVNGDDKTRISEEQMIRHKSEEAKLDHALSLQSYMWTMCNSNIWIVHYYQVKTPDQRQIKVIYKPFHPVKIMKNVPEK